MIDPLKNELRIAIPDVVDLKFIAGIIIADRPVAKKCISGTVIDEDHVVITERVALIIKVEDSRGF